MLKTDTLREHLMDFFARLHHEPEIARVRADSVVAIVREHLTGCLLGDRCIHEAE